MPPGCWPVVRLTPVQPSVRRFSSAWLTVLPPIIQILFDVTVGRLVLNTGDGAGLEHVGLAEQLFRVAVDVGLVLAREVQVNIRLLVAVETKEGLERDVVAVHQHPGAAVGAVLVGQVEAVVHAAVGDELAVLALWGSGSEAADC